jgi:hypothetical protein
MYAASIAAARRELDLTLSSLSWTWSTAAAVVSVLGVSDMSVASAPV